LVTLAAASGSSTSLAPPIIAAAAALFGVVIGQLISILQRRHDERERRLERAAGAVAKILALSRDAIEQIQRFFGAGLEWWAQPEWRRLHSEQWPIVRDLLLQQIAYEQADTKPSFLALAMRVQDLLMDENAEKEAALRSWNALQEDTSGLQRRFS
jgi:hypothetical protein